MKTCTFFGHGNCPSSIAPLLEETITKAIFEDSAIMLEMFRLGGSENPDLRYICNVKKYQHLYGAFKHLYNGRKLQISWGYDPKIKLYDISIIISDFDSANSTSRDPGIMVSFKDENNCERKMSIDEFVYQYTY